MAVAQLRIPPSPPPPLPTTSYTYDPANQLRGITGVGLYTWDANGNLLSGSNRSYNYNSADQTTSISGVALSYTGLGQTERVTRGSDSYKYNTLGLGPGLERDNAGVYTYYTRTPGGDPSASSGQALLGFRRNGSRYYYLLDGLGSVMGLTNSSGSVINTYTYDPYGLILSSSEQVAQPYRFAGVYYDTPTGLYKMGARYYDSFIGRFTQRDPEPGSAYDTPTRRYKRGTRCLEMS